MDDDVAQLGSALEAKLGMEEGGPRGAEKPQPRERPPPLEVVEARLPQWVTSDTLRVVLGEAALKIALLDVVEAEGEAAAAARELLGKLEVGFLV